MLPDSLGGLQLVPVTRPADVYGQLGWTAAVNCGFAPADQSAILRSWEDWFGAVVVSMGFDMLGVSVAYPPQNQPAIDRLLHEHYLSCFDTIEQGALSLQEYRSAFLTQQSWTFWWD